MSDKIRVLVVDDHDMVRQGLIVLLENFDDLEICGEAKDGEMAVNMVRNDPPDVVLMDMVMPRMNGIDATSQIREISPQTQVIALTSFDDDDNIHAALQAGAISFLMKNVSVNELASAVRKAHAGKSTLSPEATQALITASTAPPKIGHDLTEREIDVLELMIEGLNNREIGEALFISGSTVKNHVSSILTKLDTASRTKAVAVAVEHNIIQNFREDD